MFIPDPDPGSRILDLDFFPARIPDPGVEKAPDPGSGSATLEKVFHMTTSQICYPGYPFS